MIGLQGVKSPFKVYDIVADAGIQKACGLSDKQVKGLKDAGYQKAACPFGVIIAGTKNYPDSNLQFGANLIANLLDPDGDGKPKNEKARDNFKVPMLGGGVSQKDENGPCNAIGGTFPYCFSLQTYGAEEQTKIKAVLVEEIFHMYTQAVLGKLHPTEFGETWDSSMCKETARLQCQTPGWSHPENKCPADVSAVKSPLTGTCKDPDCDCVEFFHQAALLNVGQKPGWFGAGMPKTQTGMQNLLSQGFKDIINNPIYGLPTKPLTGVYDVASTANILGTTLTPYAATLATSLTMKIGLVAMSLLSFSF